MGWVKLDKAGSTQILISTRTNNVEKKVERLIHSKLILTKMKGAENVIYNYIIFQQY